MWVFRWILTALVILIILGFALQNQEQTVSVHVLNWTTSNLPLYFILYISFAAGVLTWVLVSMLNMLKLKNTIHKLEKQNTKIREELNKLRNINIDDEPPAEPSQEVELASDDQGEEES
ncbi:LapA family protein [bacterium]|nr:LapA family protein [bacterium]